MLIYNNYTRAKGKRGTSCATTNPFWMTKSILLKTKSIDPRETTLLCMIFLLFAKDQQHLMLGIQKYQTQICH
jgi:hypothetical protein